MRVLIPPLALIPQHLPLAIVLVVVASMLFAAGAAIQHLAVDRHVDKSASNRSMKVRQVLAVMRNRTWLAGLGVSIAGGLTHILGLMLAPVTVVQPVGVLAVPWSVLLAMRIYGYRPPGKMWVAAGVTIVGVVGFTAISTSTAAPASRFNDLHAATATLVVVGFAAVLAALGRYGLPRWRCLAWAAGGSLLYGNAAALIKVVTDLLGTPGFAARPLFWFAAAVWGGGYLVGGWMIQQAYANGPAEVVVSAMTTIDPMIAVAFGIAVLGEGVRIDWLAGLGLLAAGGVALLGVVTLSQYHPDQTGGSRSGDPVSGTSTGESGQTGGAPTDGAVSGESIRPEPAEPTSARRTTRRSRPE